MNHLQIECDAFNLKYPAGTPVFLKKDGVDTPIRTEVRGPAFVLSGHSAVAFFEGVSGCYLISCVKGLAPKRTYIEDHDGTPVFAHEVGGYRYSMGVGMIPEEYHTRLSEILVRHMDAIHDRAVVNTEMNFKAKIRAALGIGG